MSGRISSYLVSLPERVLRSASGLAGGLLHEIGTATLPEGVRRSKLYTNMVEMTLRFLVESVGEVDGVFPSEEKLNEDFLLRRTAGGGLEMIGILAFRASPVWILAALSDVSGAGRHLLADITQTLDKEGLIAPGARAETVDQLLDALEGSSGIAANAINAPPLDVGSLRRDWEAFKVELGKLPSRKIPTAAAVTGTWDAIKLEAKAQGRSTFEMSAVMALSAVARFPERAYWLSRSARIAGERTGHVLAGPLLDHYGRTLTELRELGFARYWITQFRPYLRTAAAQFSPGKGSWTQRVLSSRAKRRSRASEPK